MNKSKKPNNQNSAIKNPYIEAHLLRRLNDENYEDYLKWLDKTNGNLPIKKVLTKEEWEFKNKLDL